MKGKVALIDQGRAALIVDGTLSDLFVDPPSDAEVPRPEAIYRGVVDRPLKGIGGAIVKLPDGQKGFLKSAKGLAPGTEILVQVTTFADSHKAAPVSTRIIFKSRYAIVTPDAPGINVARSIRDDDIRDQLLVLAKENMGEGGEGLIIRSSAADADIADIESDIISTLETARLITNDRDTKGVELLLESPNSIDKAWREWGDVDQIIEEDGCFDDFGVSETIETLLQPNIPLGRSGSLCVEQTNALIAIDVNTGGDNTPAAALKTNLDAAREISRQLKLRGLGGQVIIDFAPCGKKDRVKLENALKSAFKRDGVDTIVAGWTPLGNLELQRKRERFPLHEAVK